MGVNKVILVGNLGKDPELKYTTSRFPIGSFSLATSEKKKDQSGNWVDHTEWHNIVVLGKSAENCKQYLAKGRQVYIEGKIQTRKWQDKEGKDRYTTEILANTVQFIGNRASGYSGSSTSNMIETEVTGSEESSHGKDLLSSLPSADSLAASGHDSKSDSIPFEDDDIPF